MVLFLRFISDDKKPETTDTFDQVANLNIWTFPI